jgi:hypothetical protein
MQLRARETSLSFWIEEKCIYLIFLVILFSSYELLSLRMIFMLQQCLALSTNLMSYTNYISIPLNSPSQNQQLKSVTSRSNTNIWSTMPCNFLCLNEYISTLPSLFVHFLIKNTLNSYLEHFAYSFHYTPFVNFSFPMTP